MVLYIVGLIAAFVIVMLIDLPKLLQKGVWRDIIVYIIILIIGFAISLPQVMGHEVMGPAKIMTVIIKKTVGPFGIE